MHFRNIVQIVKDRRQSLQVTQEGLSELSGVGLRTLKQFESCKGNPTLATVQNIADALGMEVTLKIKDLLTEHEKGKDTIQGKRGRNINTVR